jgi:hypothetical protein
MLNLNYNLIGANQPYIDRGPVTYFVRNDVYSASLVVGLPGALFRNSLGEVQFQMNNPWDDISAYVKAGNEITPPSGSNLGINYSSSLASSSYFVTTSYFASAPALYPGALSMNGVNSLVVDKIWPENQGANFSFSSSFVIECYVAFADSASANYSPTQTSPTRYFVWKYDAGLPEGSQYLWAGNFGGNLVGYGGNVNDAVSGSTQFVYTRTAGTSEEYLTVTSSLSKPGGIYNHYAVVYTSGSEVIENQEYTRQLKLYYNGILRTRRSIGQLEGFNQDTAELLQIFGAVDGTDEYSSSLASFNDFKIYNGTDKNYTGSQFTPPPSMVVWEIYA